MSIVNNTRARVGWALAVAAAVLASACSTIESAGAPALAAGDTVAVLPIGNYTETPDAGRSAQAMSANALRNLGIANVVRAPVDPGANALFDGAARGDSAPNLDWARQQHARYALTGAVEEWRYKVGVDGEPAVGVTFELVDVESGKVLWSATGTRTGWSRSGLASVAQTLIGKLLAPLHVHA
jgi:polysaccharide biosynthesis protein PelC